MNHRAVVQVVRSAVLLSKIRLLDCCKVIEGWVGNEKCVWGVYISRELASTRTQM